MKGIVEEILWLTVEQAFGEKKLPKYKRTFGSKNGRVAYLPSYVCGYSDNQVLMCASFDGAKIASVNGKIYFDADWVMENYPRAEHSIARAQNLLNDYLWRSRIDAMSG